jgi:CRISPR type I-D-associated protein Csc3/Cas10d
VNKSVADTLSEQEYETLLLYQDGCVYFVFEDVPRPKMEDAFISELLDTLKENVTQSHEAYKNAT